MFRVRILRVVIPFKHSLLSFLDDMLKKFLMGGSFCEDAGVGVQNEYRGFKTPGDCMGERKSASPMRISRCERSDDDRTYEASHPNGGC